MPALVSCAVRGGLWSLLHTYRKCCPMLNLKASEELVAALYRQIGTASHSRAAILMENFNHPDICWRDSSAGNKQARRSLECVDENVFLQVTEKLKRRCGMLDSAPTNKERLVGNVKLEGSLDGV